MNQEFGNNLKLLAENDYAKDNCHMREIIGLYLHCNGELDEKHCDEETDDSKKRHRLIGFPMERLKAELEKLGLNWTEEVLSAIDLGKGSIVPKVLNFKEKVYFLFVIHAGEQNFKYFEETYFPFLYGMYQIECEAANLGNKEAQQKKCSIWKKKFLDNYCAYWKSENYFILGEDIEKIKTMNMREKFEDVLIKDAWNYFDDPIFNKAIEIAKKITTEELAEESDVREIQFK